MSFATVTIGGTIASTEREDKKVTARFKPDIEDAPELTITAYGEVGEKLEQLLNSPAVVTGQIKHIAAKNTFTIDVADCWVSAPFGKIRAIVSLCGRYSTKFAEDVKGAYKFQVSYPTGNKNSEGNKEYFNWKVTTFGKTTETIKKYMEDGSPIAIPAGELQWYANGDKLYLSVTARNFSFVGGGRTSD